MGLFRLHLSFTEHRRRRLAKKVDLLDRLESRTTITEPISFTGLSISALRGLLQLGLMSAFGGSNAPSPFARAKEAAKTAGRAGPKPYVIPASLLKSVDAIARDHHAGAGSSGTASSSASAAGHVGSDSSNDWLTLNAKPTTEQGSDRISTPWHPAKRPGGGPAQAPRGGSSAARRGGHRARCNHAAQAAFVQSKCGVRRGRRVVSAVGGRRRGKRRRHSNCVARRGWRRAGSDDPARSRGRGRCFRRRYSGRRWWRRVQSGRRPGADFVWRWYAAPGFDSRPGYRQLVRGEPGLVRVFSRVCAG